MSPEDLGDSSARIRRLRARRLETLRTYLAPDIEWRTTPDVPFLGTYAGIDEFLRGMDEWIGAFEEMTTQVEEMIDAGENVIVHHRMRGRGRDSGVEVDLAIYQVVAVRDGQLTRMHDYATRGEALEAAAELRR